MGRLGQALGKSAFASSPIILHAVFPDGQDGNCFTVFPYVAQNQSCHVSENAVWRVDISPCCRPRVVRSNGS